MSERHRAARLFKAPTQRIARTPEQQREFLEWLAKHWDEGTLEASVRRARRGAQRILQDNDANEESQRLARELLEDLQMIDMHVRDGVDRQALLDAMIVGWKWRGMNASRVFAKAVDDVRRRNAALATRPVSRQLRSKIEHWWRKNRRNYSSANKAREACKIALRLKRARTVRTVVESAQIGRS